MGERIMRLRCGLLVFVFSLLAGCHQPTAEERAVAEVERLGGEVRRDGKVPGMPVTAVNLAEGRVTDGQLEVVKRFPQLRSLDLRKTPITDKGLVHLEKLTKLEELRLDSTPITDSGLSHLEGLKELRKVTLNDTQVGDIGLGFLENLPKLEQISVKMTNVTEKRAELLRKTKRKLEIIR